MIVAVNQQYTSYRLLIGDIKQVYIETEYDVPLLVYTCTCIFNNVTTGYIFSNICGTQEVHGLFILEQCMLVCITHMSVIAPCLVSPPS